MVDVFQKLLSTGIFTLLAIPVVRYFYVRFYLSKRLFFEPWLNLSRNETLNLGEGLAELLFFELEAIREVLQQAQSDAGLWHERPPLPEIERSFDGYPRFVRHADLLGLPGQITKLIRIILLARPQALRGTIHQYGTEVRFQVVLEGLRDSHERFPVRGWAKSIPSDKPELIPDAVSDLAHSVVLDFGRVQGFKSPRSFRYFTLALRQHLAYNRLRRTNFLEEAQKNYEQAIELEGGNADASCNLADLLYSQFTYEANEKAIQAYFDALKTDKPILRARAFRGLANAHCQRRQRHKRGDVAALESALRWARFASDVCGESNGDISAQEKASIKKAEAYAQQVWSELGDLTDDERRNAFERAVALYKEAVTLNEAFTVAYNNLSYLYLKKAEEIIHMPQGHNGFASALELLDEAEKWCVAAINSERTFHLAYDNRGNIAVVRARLNGQEIEDLGRAIECYHQALSYHPRYTAAYSDLAKVHARLFRIYESGDRKQRHHAGLAWRNHWEGLECTVDATSKRLLCKEFNDVLSEHGMRDEFTGNNTEQIDCAAKVGCTCFRKMETYNERENTDAKKFRSANS
jgi:tetratricopeptide (TPR) repeat protein